MPSASRQEGENGYCFFTLDFMSGITGFCLIIVFNWNSSSTTDIDHNLFQIALRCASGPFPSILIFFLSLISPISDGRVWLECFVLNSRLSHLPCETSCLSWFIKFWFLIPGDLEFLSWVRFIDGPSFWESYQCSRQSITTYNDNIIMAAGSIDPAKISRDVFTWFWYLPSYLLTSIIYIVLLFMFTCGPYSFSFFPVF